MNSEAFMDEFVSKPKIGRLPPSIVQETETGKSAFDSMAMKWLLLAFVLSIVLFAGYRFVNFSGDDARLLALITSTDDVIKAKNPALYFKDSEGVIAGQMVKITPEQANALEPASGAQAPVVRDKAAEKELLSILGKH